MSHPINPALVHYGNAMQALDELRERLLTRPDAPSRALLDTVRTNIEQGFWLAHLQVLTNVREIPATPYCRRIPLTPIQGRHLELLREGMLEAQHSLAPDELAAPWNALFSARQRFTHGAQRQCFETGFLIRLFQLLQDARHGVSNWSIGRQYLQADSRFRRRPA